MAPTGTLHMTFSSSGSSEPSPSRIYERQELAASVVWILRNLERPWLQKWWKVAGPVVSESFLPMLEDLLQVFCKRPRHDELFDALLHYISQH